ncbi:hypothetical protein HII31_03036 [Pseudocercospora fuligena]|uniref:Uncharacterized protein n=1 Tax=Pseudocercospora fuligena TaxID=685502 RepID=A0A8H6VKE4_9PEZI|nr:hypothetical protein HII31_03036 [Pseudocercospora fuligena]
MAGISGLDDLLAQFKDQARETIRAEFRAETESLRSENTLLHDTIHEKDLLYQDVVRERDELAQEVQSGKLEIKELKGRLKGESSLRGRRVSDVRRRSESFESGVDRKAPVVGGQEDLDDMHEVVQQSIETQDGPAARGVTFPSFKILEQPGTKFYRDMFDESTFKDEGAALRKASLAFKPSKLQAQILRPHIWRTSLIEEQSEAMLGAKEHGPIDSMSPSGQDVAQFETLYKGSDRQRFYHEQKELERRGQPVDRRLVPSTLNTRKRLGEHMDAEVCRWSSPDFQP